MDVTGMERSHRLLCVVLFHSIFASFAEVQANIFNFLAIPIRKFFGQSLWLHYGVVPGSQRWVPCQKYHPSFLHPFLCRFEFIYSAIASSLFVGVICGGFSLAFCLERFGRKGTAIYVRFVNVSLLGKIFTLFPFHSFLSVQLLAFCPLFPCFWPNG
jgi:hypothetical protein